MANNHAEGTAINSIEPLALAATVKTPSDSTQGS
jgi:hypothetical protein